MATKYTSFPQCKNNIINAIGVCNKKSRTRGRRNTYELYYILVYDYHRANITDVYDLSKSQWEKEG